MEVHDTVQEAVIKTIPKKKKCKKAKWLLEEALQTAMKRKEVKGKGKKDRYTNFDAVIKKGDIKKSLPQRSMQRNRGKQ